MRYRTPEISRTALTDIYRRYGFTECSAIYDFLEYVCDYEPDRAALKYILEKTQQCLSSHDNGSEYFTDLRATAGQIKALLYRSSRPVAPY